jgi:RNA polymerase sigma-70 factor (ECF subfamily)
MPDKSTDPTELLHAARRGSPHGLDQLLEHYRNYLMILARTHIGRNLQAKADQSDLVQDTLLEARRDFAQFRGSTEEEFAAWLRKMMAHNGAKFVRQYKGVQARDVRREQRFEDELDRSTQMMAGLAARGSSPSQGAIRAEAAVQLANAVAQLPDHYRDAIVLHHLQGRPIKDVALAMNRTEDSIKKLLARALIRLQSELRSLR